MKWFYRVSVLVVFVSTGLLGGCGQEQPRLDVTWMADLFRSKKSRLHRMAMDTRNPRKRIEAIDEMSREEWGQQGDYVKAYAGFAQNDLYPGVRAAALRALGRSQARQHLPVILDGLTDESPIVRVAAADALVDMPDPNAVVPLTQAALDDEDVHVRSTACEALRYYRHPDGVATLVKALGDNDYAVRYRAHESLVYLTGVDRGHNEWDWPSEAQGRLPKTAPRPEKAWWDPWGWWGTDEPETPDQ
jgi:HEAT repeat protein